MDRYMVSGMYSGAFDVSHNNGVIKWTEVPKAYALVFIKATQGVGFVDPLYKQNVIGAQDTGRLVVPYHFISSKPAKDQARFFLDTVKPPPGSPVMIDWESDDPKTLPPINLVEELITELRLGIERDPLVYHGIYTLASKLINACPWHVPKYGPQPQGKYKFLFWQNTPNQVIPGVPTKVDHDYFNGTLAQMELWHVKGVIPAAVRNFRPTQQETDV